MRHACEKHTEHPTMPIIVESGDPDKFRPPFLSKPQDPGSWGHHYDIGYEGDEIVVTVVWHPELPPPVYLEFSCVFDHFVGVGFAKSTHAIKPHHKRGYCGAGFFLCTDLRKEPQTMLIRNKTPHGKKKKRYNFRLWLKKHGQIFNPDPQIYNDGTMRQEPPKERKRGG